MERETTIPDEDPHEMDGCTVWIRRGMLTVQNRFNPARTTSVDLSNGSTAHATITEIRQKLMERVTTEEQKEPQVFLSTTAPDRTHDEVFMGYRVWHIQDQMIAQDPQHPTHFGRIIHVDPPFIDPKTTSYLREHALFEIIRSLEAWEREQ